MNLPRNAASKASGVQSVERAVSILKAFSSETTELGVTELSHQLNLHKSTVSRLLASLEREGLVESNPLTRKYRLGVALVTLGGLVLQRLNMMQSALPHLQALANTTQETVNLAIRDRDEAVNIAEIPSPQTVRYIGWVGRRLPLHCTSTGKVLLAHLAADEQEAIIMRGLTRYAPNSITSPGELRQELTTIREQGYAICNDEYDIDLNGVAAPVRDHTRAVVAVVSISGPAFRLSPDRFSSIASHVQQTALKLSRQLGCNDSANLYQSPGQSLHQERR
jgi:DNA-binding IclR family transcriptional regulator